MTTAVAGIDNRYGLAFRRARDTDGGVTPPPVALAGAVCPPVVPVVMTGISLG